MNSPERKMYDYWRAWFAHPMSEKMQHLRSPGKGGYYPPASESPGFTGKPDPKEYFHWRLGMVDPWDDETPTERVFNECYDTARKWCLKRGLDEIATAVLAKDCVLRIIHYPPSPTGEVGEAHRDFDLLTVSVDAEVPGLEVQVTDLDTPSMKAWMSQETGIQVGEMLEIYAEANCHYESAFTGAPLLATTHRVRTPPNTERLKAVFFYLPPNDFELSPGFTAGDYLKGVLSKAGTSTVGVK